MGKSQSKNENPELTPSEIEQLEIIQNKISRGGPDAIAQHITENLDRWKNEPVNIGIAGRYKTGKSTFINTILGLKPGQTGAAKTGSGNTTVVVKKYRHPYNQNINMVDFPGVGTPEFPREKYMEYVAKNKCDYFFLFFDAVISEDDLWFAENLSKIKIPFCLVRSMIDRDIDDAEADGKDKSEVVDEIRQRARKTMSTNAKIGNSEIFFISSRKPEIGEFDMLLNHMEQNLPSVKYEAMVLSMSSLTRSTIEKKHTQLTKRMRIVSVGAAAISAIPIPLVDLPINLALLVHEMKDYIKSFGLESDKVKNLPPRIKEQLTLKAVLNGNIAINSFIITQIGKAVGVALIQSVLDLIIPIVGSIISSATTFGVVYICLKNILDECLHDALIIYDYVIQTQTQSG